MKPNVLFINLPTIPLENLEAQFDNKNKLYLPFCMPMGILYLSASLKKNVDVGKIGIINYPLELTINHNFKNIEEFIKKPADAINFYPDIISVTLTFACTYGFFERCIETYKKTWPKCIIIVGGIQATSSTKQLLQDKNVDYTLRGEGEIAFPEFVKCISHSLPVGITGIYSKENYLKGMSLDCCKVVINLDQIPFPDWDLIEMDLYSKGGMKKNIGCSDSEDKSATIITSRGCPFRCTFCSSHTVHGRKMRYRSIENVVEEVKILHHKYGINLFTPEDDLFTANKKRTIDLLHALKALNIPNLKLQFPNVLSINTTDPDLLDAMLESGLTVVNLALESGSEYTQKNIIKKNVNLKRTAEIIEYLRKFDNLTIRCTVIFGFPRETKDLMLESINFAKSLHADWYIFAIATPLPGSDMYTEFVERGDIIDSPDTWNKSYFANRFFDTPEISANELNDFVYRMNIETNFIHNHNLIAGNYEKAIEHFNDVLHNYPFHIIALYSIFRCYNRMNKPEQAKKARSDIQKLIGTDPRSKEMFQKFNDLFEEL